MERSECLDDETIAELVGHALDREAAERVEVHLDRCAECRRHVSDLARAAPRATSEPRPLGGRYLLAGSLGRGGMGEVFAAYDPELGRRVAVKLLHPATSPDVAQSARARLRREAHAMAKLAHPNVVSIYDVGLDGDRVFVAMELVDGATLAQWARTAPVAAILDACQQAGRGLAAAHAVGLVHRDVTPRNILIGHDGRARISDFGLARLADEAVAQGGAGAGTGFDPLTRTGELVGTPAYAPPEAFRGVAGDARGDQWSFAATAWDALYGRPPFEAATFGELARAVTEGRIVQPPAGRTVPRHVRVALARALAVDPAARFASLHDLLAALAPRRRRWWLAGAPIGLAGLGLWLALGRHAPPRCDAPANTSWTEAARADVERSFAATHLPAAANRFARVDQAFTRYVAHATTLVVETCTSDAAAEVRALRDRCVDDRLASLRALRDELARAPASLDAAVVAALSLPALDACIDTTALARAAAADAPALAPLRARFARIAALDAVGNYRDELAEAGAAAAEARAPEHAALLGEALHLLGDAQDSAGDPQAARATLEQAGRASAAAHDDRGVATAWLALLSIVGAEQSRAREALELLPLVSAAVARAGDRRLSARFEDVQSGVLDRAGRLDEAKPHSERAIAELSALLGADHLDVATAQLNYATLLYRLGESAAGHAMSARGVATLSALLGSDHVLVVRALADEGHAFADERRWTEAETVLTRALAIQERTLGADHPEVAWTVRDLAHLWLERGEWSKARAYYERALSVFERASGPASGDVAGVLANIGATLVEDGRCAEARPILERAVATGTEAFGADHLALAEPLIRQAECLVRAGERPEAIRLVDRALALTGEHDDPIDVADRQFRAAEVLVAAQPARARALAGSARDAYAAGGGRYADDRAKVTAWLSSASGAN